VTEVPFPLPARRTGQAVFPHPALGQESTEVKRGTVGLCGSPPAGLERCSREVNRFAPLSLSFSSASGLLELRPLPSTGVTRLPRYYEPVRHPRRPGPALTGVRLRAATPHRLGFPVLSQLPLCRHAVTITPVGSLGRIVRNEGVSAPRLSPATAAFPEFVAGRLPRYHFRGLLGVHCTLRPIDSPHRCTVRVSRRLRRLCYLGRRSDSFRLGRSNLAGWDLHPLGNWTLSRRTRTQW
jgi:hypothetical protein